MFRVGDYVIRNSITEDWSLGYKPLQIIIMHGKDWLSFGDGHWWFYRNFTLQHKGIRFMEKLCSK